MFNKILLFFGLLIFSLSAYSQTSDSTVYKNQLGIIASPAIEGIFKNNRPFPFGFIYKRQIKLNQAIRVSAVTSFNKQTFLNYLPDSSNSFPNDRISNSFQFLVGYEWQKNLRKRWTMIYGGDAGISYDKNRVSFDLADLESISENLSISYSNNSTSNYLFQPFAGIKFNICPRFYTALETKASVFFTKQKGDHYIFNTFDNPTLEHIKLTTNTRQQIDFNYFLLSNIQLVYQF
jgi:hypothetical protein